MSIEAIARRLFGRVEGSAVVMLTHNDDPRVVGHFERLRRECGLPTFRVNNTGLPTNPGTSSADIVLTNVDLQIALPGRYEQMMRNNGRIARGFVDILEVAIVVHPTLRHFEHLWLIESDVDFAGNWADLFTQIDASSADLVTFRVRREDEMPTWIQWKHLRTPKGAARRCAFLPLSRFSRRFGETYRRQVEKGGWKGHFEATVPSVALSAGLSIEDFGAGGEFSVDRVPWRLNHATFGYRPVRATSYFHEAPEGFSQPGLLYHPVKVGANLEQTSGAL